MTTRIAISRIAPDADQPRKKFAEDALEELALSIEESGLIQPITVRSAGRGKRGYIIIAGERRWRAHGILARRGLRAFASIECHVRKEATGAGVLIKQIAENMNREDIGPMEEARAFARLRDEFGLDPNQIAKKLGLAPFRVDWRLSLLNLSPPIARMVESGQINRQLAIETARLPTYRDQTRLVQMVNRGEIVGWKPIRSAVDTMLDGSAAADLFGEDAPKPNADDIRVVTSMERRIEAVANMVSHGWRAGQCVVACKVDPDRATHIADQINAITSALRIMERELRNTAAQATIALRGAA
jgi:ParB family chromosome partitioning protein